MRTFLGNAFSLNMIREDAEIRIRKITPDSVDRGAECAIGHADTAAIVSNILGIGLTPQRINVELSHGDILYVAQYIGPRLPEGTTKLPDGSRIEFREVTVR